MLESGREGGGGQHGAKPFPWVELGLPVENNRICTTPMLIFYRDRSETRFKVTQPHIMLVICSNWNLTILYILENIFIW